MPPGPLAGIRVVDCSTVLAGPYCTMLLADLGAEVIKVEPPEGDGTRAWGPPWVGAARIAPDDPGVAAYYLAINRNKRSIRLDLRTPAGVGILAGLIGRADILVENFRVGAFERLGFPDAILDTLNTGLIHLAISGYGRSGPEAELPGYDFVIQAVAGLMSITGPADADGGQPTKVGVAIADVATGLLGCVAILAALEGRGREGSPAHDRGQRIDLSIFESTLAVLVNQAQNAFANGASPGRRGNAHPNIVPYETFDTADGQLAIAAGSERQWTRLCAALELDGLAGDARFASNGERVAHRAELRPILAERFAGSADKRLARTARGGRGPLRPDPGCPRGARVGAGPGSFDDRRGRAPAPREPSPGWRPVQAGRDPGDGPDCASAAGRAFGRDPGRAGLVGRRDRRAPPGRRDLKPMQACRRASFKPSGSG